MAIDFRPGQVLGSYNWANESILYADFLSKIIYRDIKGIIKDGMGNEIMLSQKYALEIPGPHWRCTHVEQIVPHDENGNLPPDDEVWTASQELLFKINKRKKTEILKEMLGDKPRYMLFDVSWWDDPRYPVFVRGMMKSYLRVFAKGWKARLYDVGQIPMYIINKGWNKIRGIFGRKPKNYQWLEMPGNEVCSSRIAKGIRQGLIHMHYFRTFVFPDMENNAAVAPGHFGRDSVGEHKRFIRRLP